VIESFTCPVKVQNHQNVRRMNSYCRVLFVVCLVLYVKNCPFSTFINALGMKLNDYRDVMSDSQTSAASERLFSFGFWHFL